MQAIQSENKQQFDLPIILHIMRNYTNDHKLKITEYFDHIKSKKHMKTVVNIK